MTHESSDRAGNLAAAERELAATSSATQWPKWAMLRKHIRCTRFALRKIENRGGGWDSTAAAAHQRDNRAVPVRQQ